MKTKKWIFMTFFFYNLFTFFISNSYGESPIYMSTLANVYLSNQIGTVTFDRARLLRDKSDPKNLVNPRDQAKLLEVAKLRHDNSYRQATNVFKDAVLEVKKKELKQELLLQGKVSQRVLIDIHLERVVEDVTKDVQSQKLIDDLTDNDITNLLNGVKTSEHTSILIRKWDFRYRLIVSAYAVDKKSGKKDTSSSVEQISSWSTGIRMTVDEMHTHIMTQIVIAMLNLDRKLIEVTPQEFIQLAQEVLAKDDFFNDDFSTE